MNPRSESRWLIIDGNNLLHQHPELSKTASQDFDPARRELVRRLDELVGALASRITVVFDGKVGARPVDFEPSAVEVVFSPSHLTADSVIERLAHEARERDRITVVSSDRLERDTVEAAGVDSVSCRSFSEMMQTERARLMAQLRKTEGSRKATMLGDFFPD